jgi:glutamyl-tRNA synthetase
VRKLLAFNGEYIRMMPPDRFVDASEAVLRGPGMPWPPERYDAGRFRAMAPLVQTRVQTIGEVAAMVDFLFLADPAVDEADRAKAFGAEWAVPALGEIASALESVAGSTDAIKAAVEDVGEARGVKLGKLQAPLRVAVTGRSVGPPLFESLEVLGRDEVLRRVRAALA